MPGPLKGKLIVLNGGAEVFSKDAVRGATLWLKQQVLEATSVVYDLLQDELFRLINTAYEDVTLLTLEKPVRAYEITYRCKGCELGAVFRRWKNSLPASANCPLCNKSMEALD